MSTPPLSPARRTALTVGGVLGVLLIAWGAFAIVSLLAPETTTQRQLELDGSVRRLTVDVGNGDVTLRRVDGDAVQVRRTVQSGWREPRIEERAGSDGVVITADCPNFLTFECNVSYDIGVPDGFAIDLRASSGDLAVRGLSAESLRARVSSGDVELADVAGPIELEANSGSLTGQRLRTAALTAEVSSGEIALDFATPPRSVGVEASSGDVELTVPTGQGPYRVDTETSSGDEHVDVAVDPAAPRTIDARASSGDVSIQPR